MATWKAFLIVAFLMKDSLAQEDPVTVQSYTTNAEQSLPCAIPSTAATIVWAYIGDDGADVLYTWFPGSVQDNRDQRTFTNIDTAENGTDFSLIIRDVRREDSGVYTCTVSATDQADNALITYTVTVQVLPSEVSITSCTPISDCPGPDQTVDSELQCTCTAGGVSPQNLKIEWEGSMAAATTTQETPNGDLYDLESTTTVRPTGDASDLRCRVTGYAQDDEISQLQNNPAVDTKIFSAPECTISFSIENECTYAVITCDCDDNPGYPLEDSYNIYDGCNSVIYSGSLITYTATLANVVEGDGVTFKCRRCNGVHYGSLAELTKTCSVNPAGSSNGWIVAVVIEFLVIVILFSIVTWFWYEKKKHNIKGNTGQRSKHSSSGTECADNSGYMDLQERSTTKEQKEMLGEIPEQNVNLESALPGKGLILYHKATVIRNSANQSAVVKTLSGNATINLARVWSSEINAVMKMPKHTNVVQVIGWCDSVPKFLLTELVNGSNLRQHVMENFSPHKVHEYGNTKRKKFQVPERGNPESLSKFALDVARGLRFLLDNKFIHPGLRAQRVLLDSAGKCKLYDFVSIERAKRITSLLWIESVPYQWMSPEYLLLGTISAAGDIWSLGVLLWEIYSFGSQPYQDESRIDVENSLRKTDRLSMPTNCPGAVWQLMIQCWDQSSESRPKLREITSKLSVMCNDDKEYDEIPNNTPTV